MKHAIIDSGKIGTALAVRTSKSESQTPVVSFCLFFYICPPPSRYSAQIVNPMRLTPHL
jgi:hypothetical protein